MSHGGSEKEAGNLEALGDLPEVNTNVAIEHLLENLCVSLVLCLSHRDLGCPVNPALPLRIQHNTSYHAPGNTCLLDLAVSFYRAIPLQCGFRNGFSLRTVHSIILSPLRKHPMLLHCQVVNPTCTHCHSVSAGHCKPWIQLSMNKTMPRFPPSCFIHGRASHLLSRAPA